MVDFFFNFTELELKVFFCLKKNPMAGYFEGL